MGLRPKDPMMRRPFMSNNTWAPGGGQQFHTSAAPEVGGAMRPSGYWGPGPEQWSAAQMGSSDNAYTPYAMYAHNDAQNAQPGAPYAPYLQSMPPGTPGEAYAPYAPYSQNQVMAPALSLDLGSPDSRSGRRLSPSLPGSSRGNSLDRLQKDGGLDDSMRVIGLGHKSYEMGLQPHLLSRPDSTSTMAPQSTRTGTPLGGSMGRISPQLHQSMSLGSLQSAPAALSLDVHGLQGSPPSSATHHRRLVGSSSAGRLDIVSSSAGRFDIGSSAIGRLDMGSSFAGRPDADPIKQMLAQSRSAGRLETGLPSFDIAGISLSSSCPLPEWGNSNSVRGLFTERTNPGPGLFRGLKILSRGAERGGHRLPPCSPQSRPASSQESPTDPLNRANALPGTSGQMSVGNSFAPTGEFADA